MVEDFFKEATEEVIFPRIGHRVELLQTPNSEEFVHIQALLQEESHKLQAIVDQRVGHRVLQGRFL